MHNGDSPQDDDQPRIGGVLTTNSPVLRRRWSRFWRCNGSMEDGDTAARHPATSGNRPEFTGVHPAEHPPRQ